MLQGQPLGRGIGQFYLIFRFICQIFKVFITQKDFIYTCNIHNRIRLIFLMFHMENYNTITRFLIYTKGWIVCDTQNIGRIVCGTQNIGRIVCGTTDDPPYVLGTTDDPPYVLGITDDPSFCINQKSSDSIIIFHMEHKENKSDSIMDVTSVYKILLRDENFKDWQLNLIKLTNSPPKVAGPGSSGKPDATG